MANERIETINFIGIVIAFFVGAIVGMLALMTPLGG